MSNGIVPRETFKGYSAKSQRETMYDAVVFLHQEVKKNKKWNKVGSFFGGAVGGVIFWAGVSARKIWPF